MQGEDDNGEVAQRRVEGIGPLTSALIDRRESGMAEGVGGNDAGTWDECAVGAGRQWDGKEDVEWTELEFGWTRRNMCRARR